MTFWIIRPLKASEYHVLEKFLYEAIFRRTAEPRIPYAIIYEPELRIYYENFGKPGDLCFVAEENGEIIGAVWVRILCGEIKGFGNIDSRTPEFAISLLPEHRNRGIGAALMRTMLESLRDNGCKCASLAVQKDNYALQMYEKLGFRRVEERNEEFLMIYNFNKD